VHAIQHLASYSLLLVITALSRLVFEILTTYFFDLNEVLATSDSHMATLTGEFDFQHAV